MKRLLKTTWHSPRYVRARRRRWFARSVLIGVSVVTAWQVDQHDQVLYDHQRGSDDPISLCVFVALVVLSCVVTRDRWSG